MPSKPGQEGAWDVEFLTTQKVSSRFDASGMTTLPFRVTRVKSLGQGWGASWQVKTATIVSRLGLGFKPGVRYGKLLR